jgi:hypothetical protein
MVVSQHGAICAALNGAANADETLVISNQASHLRRCLLPAEVRVKGLKACLSQHSR